MEAENRFVGKVYGRRVLQLSHVNESIVCRLVEEVINSRRLDVIDEIVHPDYIYRAPGQELRGRHALRELLAGYQAAMPDLHLEINNLVCAADKVVLLFSLSGTHDADLMGIPATGNRVNVHGMTYSTVTDRQIVEEWELLDQLTMLRQLDIV